MVDLISLLACFHAANHRVQRIWLSLGTERKKTLLEYQGGRRDQANYLALVSVSVLILAEELVTFTAEDVHTCENSSNRPHLRSVTLEELGFNKILPHPCMCVTLVGWKVPRCCVTPLKDLPAHSEPL